MFKKMDARFIRELSRISRADDLPMPDSKNMMMLIQNIHSFAQQGYMSFTTELYSETTRFEQEIDYLKNRGFHVTSYRFQEYPLPTRYRIEISWD